MLTFLIWFMQRGISCLLLEGDLVDLGVGGVCEAISNTIIETFWSSDCVVCDGACWCSNNSHCGVEGE